jgi:tetratricopeptide (TPR) repeat protein
MTPEEQDLIEEFAKSLVCKEFNQIIPTVAKLIWEGKNDDSLAMIEEFYSKYSSHVYAQQLRINCDVWVSSIFEETGRYSESLELVKKRREFDLDNEYSIFHTVRIVRLLNKMLLFEETLKEVERAFDKSEDMEGMSLINLLSHYVEALQECSKQLPAKFFNLVIKSALEMCPEVLDLSSISSEYLMELIPQIDEEHSLANRRYSRFRLSLIDLGDNFQDISHEISFIKDYIKEEKFTYYRKMAQELLEDFEEDDDSLDESGLIL